MQPTIKLSANENCYGCSPLALRAGRRLFDNICEYPDFAPADLKQRLAAHYGVHKNNIVTGAGSVRIIEGLIQSLVGKDEEVLTFSNTFSIYGQLSRSLHRDCLFAPLTDMVCRPENLYPFITRRTRLIFISNPNNPTGTIITHTALASFLANVSPAITVVIDEAYAEYVTDPAFPDSFKLQQQYPNLVILRSFSKIYGLAALRVGYAIMDEQLARRLEANQIPFSINAIASGAAVAALGDTAFVAQSASANAAERQHLYSRLTCLGYNVIPSQANFLYIAFGSPEEKTEIRDMLHHHGILVCDLEKSGQPSALRITIGRPRANQQLIAVLEQVAVSVC